MAFYDNGVVPVPDERMGEVGAAFVIARPGAVVDPEVLLAYCREQLARYKVPRTVVFSPLPKTSTGKIQKFLLRNQARQL